MASKIALIVLFNVLFFTMVSSTYVPCPPPPTKTHPKKNPVVSYHKAACPSDILKLKVCANVLDLVKVSLPPQSECCTLIKGLVDLEAAACLCTALKAKVLGIDLNIPISLSVVLNHCKKNVPSGFQCA